MNKFAVSGDRLVKNTNPVLQNMDSAVDSTKVFIAGATRSANNLTHSLHTLEHAVKASEPPLKSLDEASKNAGRAAAQVEAMVEELREAFSIMKYVVGVALCLSGCLLAVKVLRLGQITFGRTYSVRESVAPPGEMSPLP